MKRLELQRIRRNKGYTQKEVAQLCNISKRFYEMIEQGTRRPSILTSKKIMDLLDCDFNVILNNKE